MKNVAKLLNEMREAGVIKDYAVFGAVAQMRYTEAVATMDADILVLLPESPANLNLLGPIYTFCATKGYQPEGETIRVHDWPVQFIPTFDRMTEAAITHAENSEIDGEPIRVVSALYLGVIALNTGRPKDYARILALLEVNAVTSDGLSSLAEEYDLSGAWKKFKLRFLDE